MKSMTTGHILRGEKKVATEKTVPVPKENGSKTTLIPAEVKMVTAPLLLQKTPQIYENSDKQRDHVCMIPSYLQ